MALRHTELCNFTCEVINKCENFTPKWRGNLSPAVFNYVYDLKPHEVSLFYSLNKVKIYKKFDDLSFILEFTESGWMAKFGVVW